jgi:CDP-glucose 4,6-dehydratase
MFRASRFNCEEGVMTNSLSELRQTFAGQTVLVTGHTGFKGSWLTLWLLKLGADVVGYSLPQAPTKPSFCKSAGLGAHWRADERGDLADLDRLVTLLQREKPAILFHLAAQPIVGHGYHDPKGTFDTNTGGTVNVLEAIRLTDCVQTAVFITTDKVYENQEWLWGYRENDRLGGIDPYSASKAMAELAVNAYRQSFFQGKTAVATARAGNVIGGGDFADYRLVPDVMRALMNGRPVPVRRPESVRPWQHVLEPLQGYLLLAARLQANPDLADAWNFGPQEKQGITARAIVEKLIDLWGSGSWVHTDPEFQGKETEMLQLSWHKAANQLGWQPVYTWEEALAEIVDWFKAYQAQANLYEVGLAHIQAYEERMRDA